MHSPTRALSVGYMYCVSQNNLRLNTQKNLCEIAHIWTETINLATEGRGEIPLDSQFLFLKGGLSRINSKIAQTGMGLEKAGRSAGKKIEHALFKSNRANLMTQLPIKNDSIFRMPLGAIMLLKRKYCEAKLRPARACGTPSGAGAIVFMSKRDEAS